jgi:DNA-binding transcriptional LysR family regulator
MMKSDPIFLDGRLLEIFCAAAEELHFGRAALRLSMSQPPFSQQIKRLEMQVGTALFTRTTRVVRLTPAGQIMHERAKRIAGDTSLMLRAVRQASRGEGGTLVVGLTPSAACSPLTEALHYYRAAHPDVELDLQEMNSNVMEAALRLRGVDVALMRPLPTDADIRVVEVFQEPMVLAVRRDHPWAALQRVSVKQVAEAPLIGYVRSISPYFQQMVKSMFGHAGKRPRIVQESVIPTLLTLVEAGVGVAIVPWTISRARGSTLAFLPLLDRSHSVARIVVASLLDQPNKAVEEFIKAMQHLR